MKYTLLFLVIVLCSVQNITKKEYEILYNKLSIFLFSGIATAFALIFFVLSSKFDLNFSSEYLIYSVLFGLSYGASLVGTFYAIKYGPLSITILISSYCLLIPTFYGIFALNEELKLIGIIGFIFLLISLFLMYDRSDKFKFSTKWLISIIICFIGGGMCSTVQKAQQIRFNGGYKHEFMIVALIICLVITIIMSIITKESFKLDLRVYFIAAVCGVSNGLTNLLVMILTTSIPNAILFPSISAGGIALGFFIALFYYKEKLSKTQIIGYIIGTLAVILLNL